MVLVLDQYHWLPEVFSIGKNGIGEHSVLVMVLASQHREDPCCAQPFCFRGAVGGRAANKSESESA